MTPFWPNKITNENYTDLKKLTLEHTTSVKNYFHVIHLYLQCVSPIYTLTHTHTHLCWWNWGVYQDMWAESDQRTWKTREQKDFWTNSNPPAAGWRDQQLWSYLRNTNTPKLSLHHQHVCVLARYTSAWLTKKCTEHSSEDRIRQGGKQSCELPQWSQQKHDDCSILHHPPAAHLQTVSKANIHPTEWQQVKAGSRSHDS